VYYTLEGAENDRYPDFNTATDEIDKAILANPRDSKLLQTKAIIYLEKMN